MKKQTRKENYAQNTRFPKLYGDMYWGCFKYDGDPRTKRIFANRNVFAKKHFLDRFLSKDKFFWRLRGYFPYSTLDHAELYRSYSCGVLLLVSNYGKPPPSILGMTECVSPLYSFETKSYFRRWETKEHFEKHLKGLIDLIECQEIKAI
jgi:hypothetical protein